MSDEQVERVAGLLRPASLAGHLDRAHCVSGVAAIPMIATLATTSRAGAA